MQVEEISSYDGVRLKYAYSGLSHKPCIALAMPFGLRLDLADAFFEFYRPHYEVMTWESRLILDSSGQEVSSGDFAVDNHVNDLVSILRARQVSRATLVGYCSGAGISLAAANMFPELFSALVLVHGEYALLSDESCTTKFAADVDSLLSFAATSEEHAREVFARVTSDRLVANSALPEGIDTPFTQLHYLYRYALNYLAYKSTDFKKLALSVTHRSLLLTGKRDVQANVESTRMIHGLMRNAEIHVDPGADHYGILREDSKTLAAIWNYLGTL
jgi:pimeloyl-ACP methyl ester carboxylesterase